MISVTSVEAENRFGQLLDTVQREPVSITRHGRPAAFIVSPQDMDDLLDVRRKRTRAVEELSEWTERARPRLTPSASPLTERDVVRLVHQTR
jgi:prevent-host-death family protein